MRVVGLAGRAGSGKSAVAEALARRPGVARIDLDRVAWETYAPGTPTYKRLVEAFGTEILSTNGSVDRRLLADRVFGDPVQLDILNAIIHPAVSAQVKCAIREHRERGTDLLLVEGALLASSPHVDRSDYDQIVWLDVPEDIRAARLSACGRAAHAGRSDHLLPTGDDVLRVPATGSIEAVAERLLRVIRLT